MYGPSKKCYLQCYNKEAMFSVELDNLFLIMEYTAASTIISSVGLRIGWMGLGVGGTGFIAYWYFDGGGGSGQLFKWVIK